MEIKNNEASSSQMENGHHLYPVSPNESGIGLPYAPIDWPRLGDNWRWKVGKRVTSAGYFVDRYLYPPKRLKGKIFKSKLSLEHYVQAFPGADVKAFFNSFSWKIPSSSVFKMEENSLSEPQLEISSCKAGNKLCGSLIETKESLSKTMFCDICCTVPGFCRDCCCILCSRSVDSAYEGYSFVRCEADVGGNLICGHIAHLECGLRSHMAGTVGEGINLDVEYYCRRCDARTDLLSHVIKLFETCKSIDSIDDAEKLLDVGSSVLRGSQRSSAQRLLHQFQVAMGKLKAGTSLDDVQNVCDDSAGTRGAYLSPLDCCYPYQGVISSNEYHIRQDSPKRVSETFDPGMEYLKLDDVQNLDNGSAGTKEVMSCKGDAPEFVLNADHVNTTQDPARKVSETLDPQMEAKKLDYEVDKILEALCQSQCQESEYNKAKEKLYEQRNYIQSLFQQFVMEKSEIPRHTAYVADPEALLQIIEDRANQIKGEILKLKDIGQVVMGSRNTCQETPKGRI